MSNLELDIEKSNFKTLKDYVSALDVTALEDSKLIEALIPKLQKDSRKNIIALGEKLLKNVKAHEAEVQRVTGLYDFDRSFGDYSYVAGVDEVGRGPLAGPIVSAAVMLDLTANSRDIILGIKDSKKLSLKQREELSEIIKAKALCFSIAALDNEEIDNKGIAWCNNEIFKLASKSLKLTPQLVLSDGYSIKNFNIRNEFAIKGDSKSASIAAASIVAKVYRDRLMCEYHKLYPEYGFEQNSGYGTAQHIEAIKQHGITKIHRKSFFA